MSGVKSSMITTAPGGSPRAEVRVTTVTARCRAPSRDAKITSLCWRSTRPESRCCTISATASRPALSSVSASDRPAVAGSISSRRLAVPLTVVSAPNLSTTSTPAPTVSSTASISRCRVSSSWFLRASPSRLNSTSSSLRARRSDILLNDPISAPNSSLPAGKSTRTPRSPAAMRSAPSATKRSGVVMRLAT